MSKYDLNMPLRTKILEYSIEIESKLSEWLIKLFKIDSDNPKTLGSKGSALSLKHKVDLLFDLNQLNNELYQELLLFMEIRNKLIHNKIMNSLLKVFNEIGKKDKLITIHNTIRPDFQFETKSDDEKELELACSSLYISIIDKCHKGIIKALENHLKNLEQNHEFEAYQLLLPAIGEAIDEFGLKMKTVFDKAGSYNSNYDKLFPAIIMKLIKNKIEKTK